MQEDQLRSVRPFSDGELVIELQLVGKRLTLTWKGRSAQRDPTQVLAPFFARVMERVDRTHEVVIDFRFFVYMNSSTVQPILTFCRDLSAAAKNVRLLYDHRQQWQRLSFSAMRALSTVWGNVSVEGFEG